MLRWPLFVAPAIALSGGSAVAEGLYIAGGGGSSVLADSDTTFTDNTGSTSGTVEFSIGYAADGAIGWDFGTFKTEIEAGYSSNEADGSDDAVNFIDLGVNAYYAPRFDNYRPYVGAGAGWTFVDVEENDVSLLQNETENVPHLKFISGFDFNITDQLSAGLNYKFIWSPEFENERQFSDRSTGTQTLQRFQQILGLRASYAFSAPDDSDEPRRRAAETAERFAPEPAPRRASADGEDFEFRLPADRDDPFAPARRPSLDRGDVFFQPRPSVAAVVTPAPVRARTLPPVAARGAPSTAPSVAPRAASAFVPSAVEPFAIQTGAFRDPSNVARRLDLLRASGFRNAFAAPRGDVQVVYAGGYRDRWAAAADLALVRAAVGDAFVVAR